MAAATYIFQGGAGTMTVRRRLCVPWDDSVEQVLSLHPSLGYRCIRGEMFGGIPGRGGSGVISRRRIAPATAGPQSQ
jgi:hypothetical protein